MLSTHKIFWNNLISTCSFLFPSMMRLQIHFIRGIYHSVYTVMALMRLTDI